MFYCHVISCVLARRGLRSVTRPRPAAAAESSACGRGNAAGPTSIEDSFSTLKCPYIHGYFAASFPHFNGTGSLYRFVSVNRRNNASRAARASLLRRYTRIRNRGSVKMRKTRRRTSVDIRTLFTVYSDNSTPRCAVRLCDRLTGTGRWRRRVVVDGRTPSRRRRTCWTDADADARRRAEAVWADCRSQTASHDPPATCSAPTRPRSVPGLQRFTAMFLAWQILTHIPISYLLTFLQLKAE